MQFRRWDNVNGMRALGKWYLAWERGLATALQQIEHGSMGTLSLLFTALLVFGCSLGLSL